MDEKSSYTQHVRYIALWRLSKIMTRCRWNTVESLQNFAGFKKLTNYTKLIQQAKDWRNVASKEQKENVDVATEIHREALSVYLQPDRIIGHRESEYGDEFLVKWRDLPYADCTWEISADIPNYQDHVNLFHERNTTVVDPPPSRRPEFYPIETNTLGEGFKGELRDYQLDGVNWLLFNWTQGNNGILGEHLQRVIDSEFPMKFSLRKRVQRYHHFMYIMLSLLSIHCEVEDLPQ